VRTFARVVLAAAVFVVVGGSARAARGADRGEVNLERPIVLLTASEPLDAQRLADALRTYLDEFAVDIRTAPPVPRGDLRDELEATAGLGASVRAWAVVRIADGAPGTAEIEVVDRVTAKSLVTTVPRPRRDEDLYRAVALKVQSLLRASLTEPSPAVSSSPVLTRLSAANAPPPEDHRLGLETSLAVVGFPGGRVVQQGLAVTLARRLWRQRIELALGVQALSGIEGRAGAVSATITRVPLSLAARLARRRDRWEATAGIVAEASVVSIDPTSSTLPVRSGRSVAPAAGGEAGVRLRLGARAWLGVRVAALGVIVAQHFTAQGQPLATLSGLEATAQAGLGVDLW
jgi:hypothetical protein